MVLGSELKWMQNFVGGQCQSNNTIKCIKVSVYKNCCMPNKFLLVVFDFLRLSYVHTPKHHVLLIANTSYLFKIGSWKTYPVVQEGVNLP